MNEVYEENEGLKDQLATMFAMADENKTLKEDLERLRAMSYDTRVKEVAEENKKLKRRNGELLIEMTDAKAELEKLKSSTKFLPNAALGKDSAISAEQAAHLLGTATMLPARPKTAAIGSTGPSLEE